MSNHNEHWHSVSPVTILHIYCGYIITTTTVYSNYIMMIRSLILRQARQALRTLPPAAGAGGRGRFISLAASASNNSNLRPSTTVHPQSRTFFWSSTVNPILELTNNSSNNNNNQSSVDFTNVSPKQLMSAATQVQADYDVETVAVVAQNDDDDDDADKLLTKLHSRQLVASYTVRNLAILLQQMNVHDKNWTTVTQQVLTTQQQQQQLSASHDAQDLNMLLALQACKLTNNNNDNNNGITTTTTTTTTTTERLVNLQIDKYKKRGVAIVVEDRETWKILANAQVQLIAAIVESTNPKEKLEHLYTLSAVKQKQAELLGYENYVTSSLQGRMLQQRDAIVALHDQVAERAQQAMEDNNNNNNSAAAGASKDKDVDLIDYISLDGTLQGLFALSRALFGIVISEDTKPRGWHLDVRLFHVKKNADNDEEQQHLGSFYLDPFARPSKTRTTFMGPLTNDTVYMNTNVTPPVWDDLPTPVGVEDIVAIFHEFGHVLQFLLADSDKRVGLEDNDSTLDVSEIVPQFMEHWVFHESILQTLAHLSGTTIPDEIIQGVQDQRRRSKVDESLRRVFLGQLELELFSPRREGESFVGLQRRLAEQYTSHDLLPKSDLSPMTQLVEANSTKPVAQYRYLMSEVISTDIFQAFLDADISNQDEMKKLGEKFEKVLLKPGVLVDGNKALEEMRDRDSISTEAYFKMYRL